MVAVGGEAQRSPVPRGGQVVNLAGGQSLPAAQRRRCSSTAASLSAWTGATPSRHSTRPRRQPSSMRCSSQPIATNTSMGETDLSRASRASAAPATRRSSLGCGWLAVEAALDMTPEDSPLRRASLELVRSSGAGPQLGKCRPRAAPMPRTKPRTTPVALSFCRWVSASVPWRSAGREAAGARRSRWRGPGSPGGRAGAAGPYASGCGRC